MRRGREPHAEPPEDGDVSFSLTGKCTVHLTGFYEKEEEDEELDDEEFSGEEEEEEDMDDIDEDPVPIKKAAAKAPAAKAPAAKAPLLRLLPEMEDQEDEFGGASVSRRLAVTTSRAKHKAPLNVSAGGAKRGQTTVPPLPVPRAPLPVQHLQRQPLMEMEALPSFADFMPEEEDEFGGALA